MFNIREDAHLWIRPELNSSFDLRRTGCRRVLRILALASAGGFMFQLTGCAAGLAPVFASLVESALLSLLLGVG